MIIFHGQVKNLKSLLLKNNFQEQEYDVLAVFSRPDRVLLREIELFEEIRSLCRCLYKYHFTTNETENRWHYVAGAFVYFRPVTTVLLSHFECFHNTRVQNLLFSLRYVNNIGQLYGSKSGVPKVLGSFTVFPNQKNFNYRNAGCWIFDIYPLPLKKID